MLGWVPTVPARGQQSVCRVRWARMLTVGLGPRILVCVSTWLSAARLPTRLSGQPCGQHRPPPRSSADWHLDPHGPRFPCTRSSHPSERDRTHLPEGWWGAEEKWARRHLEDTCWSPVQAPARVRLCFPACGSFGETVCASRAQDRSQVYGMSGLRDGSREPGRTAVSVTIAGLQVSQEGGSKRLVLEVGGAAR